MGSVPASAPDATSSPPAACLLDDLGVRLYIGLAAIALIPLLYLMRRRVPGHLGAERACRPREHAAS